MPSVITRAARAALTVALATAPLACGGADRPVVFPGTRPVPAPPAPLALSAASMPAALTVKVGDHLATVAFEDYVAATALSEITPVGESAAATATIYDVQTIVARTYAIAHQGRHRAEGYDLCDGTHCQLYEPARLATSRFAGEARAAAARTAGQVLEYRDRPIDALFHADCGGHTASPDQVWGTAPRPYLPSEPDRAPAVTHRQWSVSITREQLRQALNADSRTAIGRSLSGLTIKGRDGGGRVTTVRVAGATSRTLRSDDFRAAANRVLGPRGIMSTRFSLSRRGATYTFTGTGFGHGVGLCQTGALARARRGEAAGAILADYFPGSLLRIRTTAPVN